MRYSEPLFADILAILNLKKIQKKGAYIVNYILVDWRILFR